MYAVNVNVDINNQILILKNVNVKETQKYYIQYRNKLSDTYTEECETGRNTEVLHTIYK
jgi:hypothetical protein